MSRRITRWPSAGVILPDWARRADKGANLTAGNPDGILTAAIELRDGMAEQAARRPLRCCTFRGRRHRDDARIHDSLEPAVAARTKHAVARVANCASVPPVPASSLHGTQPVCGNKERRLRSLHLRSCLGDRPVGRGSRRALCRMAAARLPRHHRERLPAIADLAGTPTDVSVFGGNVVQAALHFRHTNDFGQRASSVMCHRQRTVGVAIHQPSPPPAAASPAMYSGQEVVGVGTA